MKQDTKDWKEAQQQGNRGIHVYIGKQKLRELEEADVLDLDETIEYNVSVGSTSDGRARAFVQLDNAEPED